jgi:hypothetical protein
MDNLNFIPPDPLILVVGSANHTYIFDLQNGAIGDRIYLDIKYPTRYWSPQIRMCLV